MRIPFVIASLALTGATAPDTEAAWDCKFTSSMFCPQDGPCREFTTPVWIYLTPSHKTYWRCEGSGATAWDKCDRYDDVAVSDSGEFKLFELPGRGAFAKVGPNLEVTEVLTMMHGVYINRGTCIVGPPPIRRIR